MSENLISYGLIFLWSSCSQAGSWILHNEKESQNFIGYCLKKVYWKILHCKLWWISRNALTHVLKFSSQTKLLLSELGWPTSLFLAVPTSWDFADGSEHLITFLMNPVDSFLMSHFLRGMRHQLTSEVWRYNYHQGNAFKASLPSRSTRSLIVW